MCEHRLTDNTQFSLQKKPIVFFSQFYIAVTNAQHAVESMNPKNSRVETSIHLFLLIRAIIRDTHEIFVPPGKKLLR